MPPWSVSSSEWFQLRAINAEVDGLLKELAGEVESRAESDCRQRPSPGRQSPMQVAPITDEFLDALADRLISRMRSSMDGALTRQLVGTCITEYSEDPPT